MFGLVLHFQNGSERTFGDVTQHLVTTERQKDGRGSTREHWKEPGRQSGGQTWKCSWPGTVLWGNSGRNMAMKTGRLHSDLSLSGPTPASLRTCSGMSGVLPCSMRRRPRRRAGLARRQRPAGSDRPTVERKPRHRDASSSSSSLCRDDPKPEVSDDSGKNLFFF